MSARQSVTPDINQGSVGGTSVNFGVAVVAGNTIVVGVVVYNGAGAPTITSITDTLGNTYTAVRDSTIAAGNAVRVAQWRAFNIAGGTNAVTVNLSGTGDLNFSSVELDGVLTTDPNDAQNWAEGNGTAPTVSVTTVDSAPQMVGVFTQFGANVALGVGSGYSLLQEAEDGGIYMPILLEYQLFASSGAKTVDGTIGSTENWAICGASYKSASAAAGVLSGTAIAGGVLESQLTVPGETVIMTLTGDTYLRSAP